jgi:hypothetical protein
MTREEQNQFSIDSVVGFYKDVNSEGIFICGVPVSDLPKETLEKIVATLYKEKQQMMDMSLRHDTMMLDLYKNRPKFLGIF